MVRAARPSGRAPPPPPPRTSVTAAPGLGGNGSLAGGGVLSGAAARGLPLGLATVEEHATTPAGGGPAGTPAGALVGPPGAIATGVSAANRRSSMTGGFRRRSSSIGQRGGALGEGVIALGTWSRRSSQTGALGLPFISAAGAGSAGGDASSVVSSAFGGAGGGAVLASLGSSGANVTPIVEALESLLLTLRSEAVPASKQAGAARHLSASPGTSAQLRGSNGGDSSDGESGDDDGDDDDDGGLLRSGRAPMSADALLAAAALGGAEPLWAASGGDVKLPASKLARVCNTIATIIHSLRSSAGRRDSVNDADSAALMQAMAALEVDETSRYVCCAWFS
jgi:hypothetical protein